MFRPLCCFWLFVIACAANFSESAQRDTSDVAYPALPDSIISKAGWTKVHRPPQPFYCGQIPAIGCFNYESRTLSVVRDLSNYRAWWVLEHEKYHMLLGDAKLTHVGTDAQQDSVADALGSLRVLERMAPRRCSR